MHIQLPDFVLAGLYKDSIVLAEKQIVQPKKIQQQITNKTIKDETEEKPLIKKWFLGDNKKNIIILLKDPSSVHINDEWLGILTKLSWGRKIKAFPSLSLYAFMPSKIACP